MPLLDCHGLTRAWGAFRAVDDVHFSVEPGETCAVIGPNGAGKSTLFALIAGNLKKTAGSVTFAHEDISSLPPHGIAARGIARTFQLTAIFPGLTATENVRLGLQAHDKLRNRPIGGSVALAAGEAEAQHWLERVGLAGRGELIAGEMAHGDQRLLEVAMALAQRPRLLVLDEPTQGMSGDETRRTVDLLGRLIAEEGVTVLLVEHDMDVVFALAPRIIVLHRGRKIADGPAAQVRADPDVQSAYLGGLD